MGILESQRLWASDATDLNDPTEILYARALYKDWFDARTDEGAKDLLARCGSSIDCWNTSENLFCLWAGAPDQLIEGIGLTLNGGFPILVDKVVVSGKLIVKIARRHAYKPGPTRRSADSLS